MRATFGIAFALINATLFSVDASASGALRGANDVGLETRVLDQTDGSGSDDSIIWVDGSKAELEERKPKKPYYGCQKRVCQINFPKNWWCVDILEHKVSVAKGFRERRVKARTED